MAKNRPNKKNLKSSSANDKKKSKAKGSLARNPKAGGKKTHSGDKGAHKNRPKADKRNKNDFKEANIKGFSTLEQYKVYISHLCTRAITYPETDLKHVNLLFNIVEKKGGGSETLLEHVKSLATLSLVSVTCHLLPRISHELDEVDPEVLKRTETSQTANIIGQEREISTRTSELRDRLVRYIKANVAYNPSFFVPLISRLVEADNRVHDELLTLCLKYSKDSSSCLSSLGDLFSYGSILDVHRYLKLIFKSPHINHKVVRLINDIQINKKHHEFLLSESTLKTEEKKGKSKNKDERYKNEIVSAIITFYTKTLREGKDFKLMESCIDGLGKYGLVLEENLRLELLTELKKVLQDLVQRESRNHRLVISGINTSIKLLKLASNFEYNWLYEVFTKLCLNITPLLFQGELALSPESKLDLPGVVPKNEDPRSVFFTHPCYTHKFLKCLDNVSSLLLKSTITADFQVLTDLVQGLVSLSLLVDPGVALSVIHYVNDITSKVPKLSSLLSKEGIVFSILTRGRSSYWELRLLSSHFSPYLRSFFGPFNDPNTVNLKNKTAPPKLESRDFDVAGYFNYTGLEAYQILFSPTPIETTRHINQ